MIRSFALSLGASVALAAASAGAAGQSFPVVHSQPITIRVVDASDGHPLAHVRLNLTGGYEPRDLRVGQWRQEAITDAHGEVRLSNQLANLPFLQLSAAKNHLCHAGLPTFSVEQIRGAGLSAPNRCGAATVENAPGLLVVFVKVKPPPPPPSEIENASY